jgi:hypothetical protein
MQSRSHTADGLPGPVWKECCLLFFRRLMLTAEENKAENGEKGRKICSVREKVVTLHPLFAVYTVSVSLTIKNLNQKQNDYCTSKRW